MPLATFIQTGDQIDHTPSGDLDAGAIVVLNDLVGIARTAIQAGQRGSLAVTGVFAFPKAAGPDTAIAAGAKVYWDVPNDRVTLDDAFGTYLGKAVAAATEDDPTVRVRLEQ